MTDNKVILTFGLIAFYVFFGLVYLAIGNTLIETNQDCKDTNCLYTTTGTYNNGVLNEDTNTLLTFVVNGFNGAPVWLNWFMVFLTALLVTMIVIMILHG